MSSETIYNELFEACRSAIAKEQSARYTATVESFDEDGMTIIVIDGAIDVVHEAVSAWNLTIFSEDYDGNEIVTERAALADRIDVLALEKELNDYFRAA